MTVGLQGQPRVQLTPRSTPESRTGVWAEGLCMGAWVAQFLVAVASSVDMGTGLPSSLTSYCREKQSPKTNFTEGGIRGSSLWGFSCLLAQGLPQG